MYTRRSLDAIRAHELELFGGDSDFRYDSREAFHAAHAPRATVRIAEGIPISHIEIREDGTLVITEIDQNEDEQL